MIMSLSVREELIKDLRKSAKEEMQAIAKYKQRAAYAAKYNLPILREYKRIIKDETEHYHSFIRQIGNIKRMR